MGNITDLFGSGLGYVVTPTTIATQFASLRAMNLNPGRQQAGRGTKQVNTAAALHGYMVTMLL